MYKYMRSANLNFRKHLIYALKWITTQCRQFPTSPEQWQKRAKEAQWKPFAQGIQGLAMGSFWCSVLYLRIIHCISMHFTGIWYSMAFLFRFNSIAQIWQKPSGRREVSTLLRKWHVANHYSPCFHHFVNEVFHVQTFQICSDDFPKQRIGPCSKHQPKQKRLGSRRSQWCLRPKNFGGIFWW